MRALLKFGEQLQQKRLECRQTVQSFAAIVGITEAHLNAIEEGKRAVPVPLLLKISHCLKYASGKA